MPRPQSREVTAELERQAWSLRMRFQTQEDIAAALGVSQETVSRMLKRTGEKLAKAFQDQIAEMRAEQTGQLAAIAKAAFTAWE